MKSPKREKDTNKRAMQIMQLATGEKIEVHPEAIKNTAAVALGKLGGKARAEKLTPARKSAIAKKGASKRWEK